MIATEADVFTRSHTALTGAVTGVIVLGFAIWRLHGTRAWIDRITIALLAGLAVFLYRTSANLPQLNRDGLSGYSANDGSPPSSSSSSSPRTQTSSHLPTRDDSDRSEPRPPSLHSWSTSSRSEQHRNASGHETVMHSGPARAASASYPASTRSAEIVLIPSSEGKRVGGATRRFSYQSLALGLMNA